MAQTMAAYRIGAWTERPTTVEVPVPEPGPSEVLVKVAGCGLCHSDLTMIELPGEIGELLGWQVPFTLGHETAGYVAATGSDVSGYAEGDPVALVSPASCGVCRFCERGLDSVCPERPYGRGYGRDGGLAEYVLVDDARFLVPLDPALDPVTAGVFTDAGATSFHGVRRVLPRVPAGGTAVVIGVGGLGGFAVQFLRRLTDARVVAVDTDPAQLARAAELGAHETLPGDAENVPLAIRALTDGGHGADAVLDFVGATATLRTGLASLAPGGSFGLVGAGGGGLDGPWFGTLPNDAEVFTFQGSSQADLRDVLALAASGDIRNDVTLYPFSEVDAAYKALHDGTLQGRAVVTLP
ncbi:alcohol dehydrogenase catalytic domain-containing protein [Actinocorallia sp. API 0066]|uniref:alcohol dehydrogenase catalytic domain-containing protein n=1 Tax=Actinocorallia sp. API 0066 TaxID=2896846 RepID=UPI001E315224|nr:alcohol dehydrogenase catalytic domain-containing protein [Actinocorallia sp. API 0066]MCD0449881.1 alcohol dehydrogenase catalytic domain-containing protein [Actinocorallia sp. API 0066]